MGLMEIIGQLIGKQNGGSPPGATPPYMPQPTGAGGQPPPPNAMTQTPMMPGVERPPGNVPYQMGPPGPPMGPPEVAGPPKHLLGDLGVGPDRLQGPPRSQLQENGVEGILANQIGVPEREKAPAWIDQKWYKDKDRMGMLLAAASNGFGNMTLRGNSGLKGTNDMLMKVGMQGIEDNKTMKYLAENNPEMFRVMTKLPPNQRGEYMKLAMQSKFRKATGADDTAAIRNFEYFENLDDEGQKAFLGVQRGDKIIKGTDGSVQVRRADGSLETVISSEDALTGTSRSKNAESEGNENHADFKQAYRAARYADDNISNMVRQIERLEQFPDRGGIFQPITQAANEILAEFGNQDGLDKATAEQLNESDNIRRTMQWFQDSGLGARGLDTPAEFMNWLKMNGGNLSMTNEASIQFLKRAIADQTRNVGRYNEMLDDDVYSTVNNRDSYQRFDVTDPYAIPVGGDVPPLPPGFQF